MMKNMIYINILNSQNKQVYIVRFYEKLYSSALTVLSNILSSTIEICDNTTKILGGRLIYRLNYLNTKMC